jgi:lambda family phage portal protein
LLPYVERPGSTHGCKLEILPSTRLAQHAGSYPDIVQGVRLDRDGAPVGYLFTQPKRLTSGLEQTQDVYVKARDEYGRPAVIHVFDGAPTAVRGISVLVAVLKVIKQYEQLADATLIAALIQAILVATVESDAPTADIMRALQSNDEQAEADELRPGLFDDYMAKRFDWYDRSQIDLGKYGKIAHMFTGEKLNLHKSEHPNTGYTDFSKGLLREIARCLGITYEQFTGDYIGATYSSIRMGIADAWPLNLYRRAVIPARIYQAVFEAWLAEDIEVGATAYPGGIEAFLQERQFVCRAEWRGPPRPTADDEKTAKAQQIARQEGWMPTEQLAAEYGNDHRTVIESQARTNELRKKNKLDPLPSKEGGAPLDNQKKPGAPGAPGEDKAASEADAISRDPQYVAGILRGEDAAY